MRLSCAALAVAAGAAPQSWAQADPPPGRAYELVSPADDATGAMAGLSTDMYAMPGRLSDDGDAAIYGAGSSLGPNWSGPTNPMVFGWRTDSGWEARTAIRSADYGETPMELIAHEARSGWLSPDGREFVFGVGRPLGVETGGSIVQAVHRTTSGPTLPDWLSEATPGIPLAAGVGFLDVTAGGDGNETVAFESSAPLTPDAPAAGTPSVYVNRGGSVELISRRPDGTVAAMSLANGFGGHGAYSLQSRTMRNQVAGGGRFVLIGEGTSSASSLYVRDLEAGVTRQLAGGGDGVPNQVVELRVGWGSSRNVTLDSLTMPAGGVFAARDAARAFFHTSESSGAGFMYDANLETGVVTARAAITGPPLALSRDGERMLFLEPPASSTTVGDWTLRFWDAADPATSVPLGTIPVASSSTTYGFAQGFEPSPDGRHWAFTAMGALDPDRPNASPTVKQLYVWSVGDAAPRCLTCEPTDGVARPAGPNVSVQESPTTEYLIAPTTPISTSANPSKMAIAQPGRAFSADGRWLLFDSPDRLAPGDVNDVRDVYLWDRDAGSGGELQLVTRGVGSAPSYALDLDPTGQNAFFSTKYGLVPADVDGAFDVYVARIGGGFPNSPESSCVGEGCRPAGGAPAGPAVGSVDFSGRGNAVAPGRASLRIARLGAVRGRVARLRVRVPGAGRLSVAGGPIRNAGRRAGKAGSYSLRVALKPRARRALARRGRLSVRVRVVYRSETGRRTVKRVRMVFKQPKTAGRKGGR